MKKRPNILHKLFSYSRWQRRFRAKKVLPEKTNEENLEILKTRIIEEGEPVLSRGSTKDLQEHYANLRQEFSGHSELAFHHAMLIVLIRREFELKKTFIRFESLWEQHGDWLLKNLNIRWLMSASDTFADHSQDSTQRALALATITLVNTVKAYETENIMTHHTVSQYDPQVVAKVQKEAIPLLEGMSCYSIGTDDTLRNMVWRMKDIAPDYITGQILLEIFNRMSSLPTAFGRMRQVHTRQKTQFWS